MSLTFHPNFRNFGQLKNWIVAAPDCRCIGFINWSYDQFIFSPHIIPWTYTDEMLREIADFCKSQTFAAKVKEHTLAEFEAGDGQTGPTQ